MLKFHFIFLILLNINFMLCDDCSTPRKASHWEKFFGGTCCTLPQTSVRLNTINECLSELKFDATKSLPINNTAECLVMQCLLNKSKLLGADGKAVIELAKKRAELVLTDSKSWIPLVHQLLEKCYNNGNKIDIVELKKKASEPPYNIDKSCNPMAGYYLSCLSVALTVECPEASKINSPECDKERSVLKKCPEQYLLSLET